MNNKYDVIVAGGGTAGAIAAIAAARGGAKTLVIERFGHLGGTAVYGIPFLGVLSANGEVVNKGILEEIIQRLKKENACFGYAQRAYWNTPEKPDTYQFSLIPFDPEFYKYIVQEMLLEAGAEILFYSQICGATTESRRVKSVDVINKGGKQTYFADVFIDCTGDADLTYFAGGQFIQKDKLQNCSILFRIGGVDLNQFEQDLKTGDRIKGFGTWHTRIIKSQKCGNFKPSLVHMAGHFDPENSGKEITFTAVSLRDGEIFLNATRSVGYCGTNPMDVTSAEISERRNVIRLFKMLKEHVPAFKNATLLYTSPVGFRETRNIIGEYTLTREDVLESKEFFDCVARGAYPIDIHDPNGGRTQFQFIKNGGSYSVPYRSMLPKDLKNVIVAGRCISATHDANGTTRIMGCVAAQGEAAGTAAALSVKNKTELRLTDIEQIKNTLTKNGAII